MPAAGARSGTRPSRAARGAGSGTIGDRIGLTCGHTTDEQPIAKGQTFALYQCPRGCGLVKRAPRARTTERKEERRDSYGDQRRSEEGSPAR
jgi:hypothetical protein